MTKTNKTLLCVLLAMVLTFALALTALTTITQTATAEGEKTYTKVTENLTDWSGEYLVVYEKSATEAYVWNGADAASGYTEATIANNSIVTSDAVSVTIAKTTNGYSIKVNGGTNSGKYAGQNSDANGLKFEASAIDNTITYESGSAKITASSAVLRFNATSGQMRFRYYKSASYTGQKAIQLYKLVEDTCEHDLVEVPAVAATCTKAGNNAYYKCSLCGKFFADAEAAKATTEEAQSIPALGHSFGDWVFDNVAHTATRECSVCHETETKDNTAVAFNVNGETAKGDPRSAVVEIANDILTVTVTGNAVYQGEAVAVQFETMETTFNYANYTVTVEGGTLDWGDSVDTATITVADNALEVNITVVYNCPHTNKTYTHIDGTETHKVVCADCGATVVEEEACVATGENVATCMKAGKCDLCGGAIAKLAHGSEGCTHTAEEIVVLKAYDLGKGATLGAYTLTGVYRVVSSKYYLEVGSLSDKRIMLYNGNLAAGSETPVDGDTITVTGTIKNYNGTIEFDTPTYSKVTVVASKFEVSQSISAGDRAKEATDEATGAKTIYVKNGSLIVVTYKITANDGINTFIATLKYNKALFSIVSVTITDGFGAGAAVKSGNVGVADYKVYIEGDGEGFTSDYTGEFVTVVYQFNGDATATINASDFGLDEVTCYTNNASGFVDADKTIGTSDEAFDFIKQASITVEETSFVYNGKAITAIGKGEHDQIKVTADGEGAISYKWYTDDTYATEVGEGYEVKNAGKYYLKLIVATTAAYEGSELNVEITITPFDLKNADSEIVITANDKQVTGSALTWTVAELTINGGNLATARGYDSDENIFTATIAEHALTNVGDTETVAVTLALNANYTYGGEGSVAATVTLKVVAYANAWTTEPQNITKDFDNNKLTFAYAAEHGMPVYYIGGEVKTAEELANAIVNAGTYEVKIVVEVVGYSNLEKTITITINKLKIDASSIVFNYSEDGKIKWSHPTKAIGSAGAIDLPTAVEFTYTLVDGKTENYDKDAILEYLAQAEGAYTLNVIPGDAVNYEGTSATTKTVYMITFAEGTHDGDNVIEGVEAYATVYRFDGQNAPAAPVAPVLEGYRFDGWTNNDKFGVAVTANVAHEAQWVKVYTITWYGEDGTSVLKTVTADVNTAVKFDGEAPAKAATAYIDYAFAKWADTTDASKLYDLTNEFTLTENVSVKATFTGTVARMSVSYKVVDGKGTASEETDLGIKAVGTTLENLGLPELTNYKWFKLSAWMNGETEFATVVADELTGEHKIVLVATYSFNVGLGDVDGSGDVDTADIVLYRKHIVGGYDITVVDDAWTTATAADFDGTKVYFLAQVANVDENGTNDVRDVSTIRMALVDGYGYTVKDGAVVKGNGATAQSAKVQYKQVLAPMGLFGKKFAL